MGFKVVDLADPSAASDALWCSVCKDILDDPVYWGQPCQHIFCRACVEAIPSTLDEHCDSSKIGATLDAIQDSVPDVVIDDVSAQAAPVAHVLAACPVCGEALGGETLRSHQLLQSLVSELQVLCVRRCGWVGRRDALASHSQACPEVQMDAVRTQLAERESDIVALEVEQQTYALLLEERALDPQALDREARIAEIESGVADRDDKLIGLGKQFMEKEVRLKELEEALLEQGAYVALAFEPQPGAHEVISPTAHQAPLATARSHLEDVIAGTELDM